MRDQGLTGGGEKPRGATGAGGGEGSDG